jgi:general stress protein 26
MNEEIFKFIESNNIGVLSVMRPDGSIHGASLHFSSSREPLEFYFATSKGSRKAAGLVNGENAKASLVIGFKEEEMITVQLDGDVVAASDAEEIQKIKDIHFAKHPSAKRFENDPNGIYLKFKPIWWRYSAFKASPPVFIES